MAQDRTQLIKIEGCKVTPTALELPAGMREEQWTTVANRVTNVGHGYWWWVGALANHAYHHFKDPEQYVQQLADATGVGVKYLRMVAFAEKRYAVRDRISGLSITHHMHCMYMPHAQRQAMLHRALERKWPIALLDQHLKKPEKREIFVILAVPHKTFHNPRFQRDLKQFAETWEFRWYTKGTKRDRRGDRLRGTPALLG